MTRPLDQIEKDIAIHRRHWQEKMQDFSPTRRDLAAPLAESWMRLEEDILTYQQTVDALRTPQVSCPERE